MVKENRQVLAALAQRRHADRKHIQAKVQVLPEAAGADLVIQIENGRGDHAHVRAPRLRVADPLDLTLLQGA
jgi:hypothetical protein